LRQQDFGESIDVLSNISLHALVLEKFSFMKWAQKGITIPHDDSSRRVSLTKIRKMKLLSV